MNNEIKHLPNGDFEVNHEKLEKLMSLPEEPGLYPLFVKMMEENAKVDIYQPPKQMTVQDLRDRLNEIEDGSTPVFLESGQPVHYCVHGMNSKETCFYIGVM